MNKSLAKIPQSHPYAEIFPLADGQPMWELRDDLKAHGRHEEIVLYKGQVLGGRRRQACLLALGMQPRYRAEG